jgi:hypothetical protein
MQRADLTVLCIVGDSRSGSTLLQYLLGAQGGVASAGELRRIGQLLAQGRGCSCGAALQDCPRWGPLLAEVGAPAPRTTGVAARRFTEIAVLLASITSASAVARLVAPAAARRADTAARLYAALSRKEQVPVIVDASKDPGHVLELALSPALSVRPVFLFRDGRAVVHSQVRRTGIDADVAIRHWARLTRAMLLLRRLKGGATVHYEALCADPRITLAKLLKPYGLRVELRDPPPAAADQHFLGGSPGFAVASVAALRADESWRSEAPATLIARFEALAGPLNRRLGYGDL